MALLDGEMVIETGWSCTIRVVESVSEHRFTEIPAVPPPTPEAVPCDPDALLIVVTVADEEVHVAVVVMLAVVPSV
jgi:hypothetical protein